MKTIKAKKFETNPPFTDADVEAAFSESARLPSDGSIGVKYKRSEVALWFPYGNEGDKDMLLGDAIAEGTAISVEYLKNECLVSLQLNGNWKAIINPNDHKDLSKLSPPELECLSLGFGGVALCLESKDLHISIKGLFGEKMPIFSKFNPSLQEFFDHGDQFGSRKLIAD